MAFNWKKFASVVKSLAPLIAVLVPNGEKIAGPLVNGIAEAEQLEGASGPEKKQHVLGIVEQAIVAANSKKKVLDPEITLNAASHAIETVVGVAQLVHNNHPGEQLPAHVEPPAALPQGDGAGV